MIHRKYMLVALLLIAAFVLNSFSQAGAVKNLYGGTTGPFPYQSATSTTAFSPFSWNSGTQTYFWNDTGGTATFTSALTVGSGTGFYHVGSSTHTITLDQAGGSTTIGLPNTGTFTLQNQAADLTLTYDATARTFTFTGGPVIMDATVAKPLSVTDNGTTIASNAKLSSNFRTTALTANVTLSNPTNGTNGQKAVWEVIQNASAAKTLAFDTAFGFGAEITGCTISATLSSHNFITAIYNSTTGKWYVVGCVTGY